MANYNKAVNNKTIGDLSGLKWYQILYDAKRRHIKILISQQEAWDLFIFQNRKCALSGIDLVHSKYLKKENGKDVWSEGTASLDRIDSNKDYTLDNIQWIHKDINLIKNDFIKDEFINICNIIANFKGLIIKTIQPYDSFKPTLNSKFIGELSGDKWSTIKSVAISRKLEFNISQQYAWELFLKQDKKCALSGQTLSLPKNKIERRTATASLDRIDSTKGYIEGNIQWVHKIINIMKNKFDQNIFINWCKLISSYNRKI